MTDLQARLSDDRARLSRLDPDRLDAPVPSCPGWSVSDLLVHLGRVHRWARVAVDLPTGSTWPKFPPRPAPGEPLLPWIDRGLAELEEVFATADLATPAWGFAGDATIGWWLRRQALETVVHRWDAQAAQGTPEPIDGDLAVTGIDEWCELEAARWFTPAPDLDGTVHLHATDGDGEWLVTVSPAGFSWTPGHHKGDVAVRASRSDLYLFVWNRADPAQVEILGDAELLARIRAASAVG